jgi:hypothetical protein
MVRPDDSGRSTMQVKLAEMELQALWYLESLERIWGDVFRGEVAPKIWINVAMIVANMVDAAGEEGEVPPSLVRGLVEKGLVEKTADDLFRITLAGKETLCSVAPEGVHHMRVAEPWSEQADHGSR